MRGRWSFVPRVVAAFSLALAACSESSSGPSSASSAAASAPAPTLAPSASTTSAASSAPAADSAARQILVGDVTELFDGAPDPAIPTTSPVPFGRATITLPKGWAVRGGWDSVDHVARPDGLAEVLLLRLEVTDALLETAVSTWVKVPFGTNEVAWSQRLTGKVGPKHMEAKIARGSGKIREEDAEFFQVALAHDGSKYGLVVVGAVLRRAPDDVRAELATAIRSMTWD
jgi:hypothetical protein